MPTEVGGCAQHTLHLLAKLSPLATAVCVQLRAPVFGSEHAGPAGAALSCENTGVQKESDGMEVASWQRRS